MCNYLGPKERFCAQAAAASLLQIWAMFGIVCGCGSVPSRGVHGSQLNTTKVHQPPPPSATFSEAFTNGTAACWVSGPSSCTQTWANSNGAMVIQSIVAAPGSGWNHAQVMEIPGGPTPATVYTIGTTPYVPAGVARGDVTVEFSYDSTGFPSQGVFWLTAYGYGSPFYQLVLDGAGNCVLGAGESIPCAANQRHLLHVHFNGALSYDQIDGGNQNAFTEDSTHPFSEVALVGSSATDLYFGQIAIGFNGFNSCLASPQALFDAAGGKGVVSASKLNAGTHGGNSPGGWGSQSILNVTYNFVADGSSFSAPVIVCGTSYGGNTGKAVRLTLPISSSSDGFWETDQITSYIGYSVGFAFSFTSTGLNNGVDFFALADNYGIINNVQLNIVGTAQRVCFENDYDTSGGASCIPVDVSPSTPYWLSFGTSATGDDTVYLYSYPSMTLLGSAHINPNSRPAQAGVATFLLGKTGDEPIDHNMTLDFWNVLIDVTGGKVPLLPQ